LPGVRFLRRWKFNGGKSPFLRSRKPYVWLWMNADREAEIAVQDKAVRFSRLYTRPAQGHAELEDLEFCLDPSYMFATTRWNILKTAAGGTTKNSMPF